MVSFNSNYDKILIKYDTAIVYLQFSMLLKITWQSLYITKSRSSICTIKICCKSCYSINRKGGILVYSPPSKLIRSRNSTCTIQYMLKKLLLKKQGGGYIENLNYIVYVEKNIAFYYIKFNILPLGVSIEYKKKQFYGIF